MTHTGKTTALASAAITLFAMAVGTASAGTAIKTGGRTTQPIGHYEFCKELPQECRQKTPAGPAIELTRKLWTDIVHVNADVNIAVTPRTDMEMFGVEERWNYPIQTAEGLFGDCEDYALEKRRRLMAMGVPAGDLLMTVVRQPNGDGHAVLTVRTSLGDFVLDNLEPRVLSWDETPYTFLKRQSSTNSGVWVSIEDGRADSVASVR